MQEGYSPEHSSTIVSEPPHGRFFSPDFYRSAPRAEGFQVMMLWCDKHIPQEAVQQTKRVRAEKFREIHGRSVDQMSEEAQQLFNYMCLEEGMTNARMMLAYVKFAYWENRWQQKDIDAHQKAETVKEMQQRREGVKEAMLDAGLGGETLALLDRLIEDASSLSVPSR